MTPYETASLAVANGNMVAAIIAAAGIWVFGVGMLVQNWFRAKDAAEDRKAAQAQAQAQAAQAQAAQEQAQAAQAQAQAQAAQAQAAAAAAQAQARAAQEQARAAQEQAAEDRKVTQGMLAALQELIRRTSPPSSQDGPRPGPAE